MISEILNNVLYLSLLLVFVSSIIGVFIRIRSKDRCLRDFDDFSARIEMKSGKIIWGKLEVFGTGIELEYPREHQDSEGHYKNSYLLYNSEFSELLALYRYHDELTEKNQERREKDIKRTYRPNLISIALRKTRNFFNTFRDGISQTLSVFLGTLSSSRPKSALTMKQKDLTGLGSQIITTVGNAFDPMIEQNIGQYVVVELSTGDAIRELYGILKEYSDKFIELLNVRETKDYEIDFPAALETLTQQSIFIAKNDEGVQIQNTGDTPVYIRTLVIDDQTIDIQKGLSGFSKLDQKIERIGNSAASITLSVSFIRQVDMIIPRGIGLIRHAGRKYRHNIETLLGLGKYSDDLDSLFSSDPDIQ